MSPPSPTLRWVLARAFGGSPPAGPVDGGAAFELAQVLGLSARVAQRADVDALEREVGAKTAAAFKRSRTQVVAQELRLQAALVELDAAAADLGVSSALLKGQALALAGIAPAGVRPSADVDLLVAAPGIHDLQRELMRRGFQRIGGAYEHQAPPLQHGSGAVVELHRLVLGVRLDRARPRRSATFGSLAGAGLLRSLPANDLRLRSDLRVPCHEVLAAHALVHALAQHALAPSRYSGFLMLADLVDLGFAGDAGRAGLATILPWIERELRRDEVEAALDLATALTDDDERLYGSAGGNARLLLDHFYAGITDSRYAESLKSRLLERPLSDLPRPIARLAALLRAFTPEPPVGGEEPSGWAAAVRRLAARTRLLSKRWRSSRAAKRAMLR